MSCTPRSHASPYRRKLSLARFSGCKTLMRCKTFINTADRLPFEERLRRRADGCTVWRNSSTRNRKTSGLKGGMENQMHMCANSSRLAVPWNLLLFFCDCVACIWSSFLNKQPWVVALKLLSYNADIQLEEALILTFSLMSFHMTRVCRAVHR